MTIIDYLEDKYLGGKRFTNNTRNFLKAIENGVGCEPLIYFFNRQEIDGYIQGFNFNNLQHFEATIIKLIKMNAINLKEEYSRHLREVDYNLLDEPRDFSYKKREKIKTKYLL